MNRKIKRIPQTTLSMKRAFDEFVVAQTAKGLTEPTIKNCHAHFHSISRHIDIEKSFSDLTQTDIEAGWQQIGPCCIDLLAQLVPRYHGAAADLQHRVAFGVLHTVPVMLQG